MIRKRSLKFSFIITCCILLGLLAGCNDSSPPTFTLDEPDVDDISLLATLSVSNENPGGPYGHEGSGKLIDGDRNSKFLTFEFHEGFWMQQDFDEQVSVNAYTMTSGNDAPERDPLHWTLAGSNDGGESWDVLHTVTDAVFAGRNSVTIYELDSDATYSSFRLSITDNAGETTLMQLSEWRLLYYNEPIPQF